MGLIRTVTAVFTERWEDESQASFVLLCCLQKAMATDQFSNLSADSGEETFPASGVSNHPIRCCYEGGVDNLVRGVFIGL